MVVTGATRTSTEVTELFFRQGVRALVIDDAERILLVRFDFDDGELWATPGGGVEADETPEEAIRRELHEEVGLRDVELGPVIWRREHVFSFGPYDGQRETFYLVRRWTAQEVPLMSDEELRAEKLGASRWWSLADVRQTLRRTAPRDLVTHVENLLVHGPPEEIIDVGV